MFILVRTHEYADTRGNIDQRQTNDDEQWDPPTIINRAPTTNRIRCKADSFDNKLNGY